MEASAAECRCSKGLRWPDDAELRAAVWRLLSVGTPGGLVAVLETAETSLGQEMEMGQKEKATVSSLDVGRLFLPCSDISPSPVPVPENIGEFPPWALLCLVTCPCPFSLILVPHPDSLCSRGAGPHQAPWCPCLAGLALEAQ